MDYVTRNDNHHGGPKQKRKGGKYIEMIRKYGLESHNKHREEWIQLCIMYGQVIKDTLKNIQDTCEFGKTD